jgi:hypothetical protein
LKAIAIPVSVEVICEASFAKCASLATVTFSGDSKLSRLEDGAFFESGLTAIAIPASVEVICEVCFAKCASLASVAFSAESRLARIEDGAFAGSEAALDCFPLG